MDRSEQIAMHGSNRRKLLGALKRFYSLPHDALRWATVEELFAQVQFDRLEKTEPDAGTTTPPVQSEPSGEE